jgi:hypothetical protein
MITRIQPTNPYLDHRSLAELSADGPHQSDNGGTTEMAELDRIARFAKLIDSDIDQYLQLNSRVGITPNVHHVFPGVAHSITPTICSN